MSSVESTELFIALLAPYKTIDQWDLYFYVRNPCKHIKFPKRFNEMKRGIISEIPIKIVV